MPVKWTTSSNIRWKCAIPGEGSSSPIVWEDAIFVTSSSDHGSLRQVHRLDFRTGQIAWSREIEDDDPERTSAITGHAAPTPVTDGRHIVAFFGNAGIVCYDFAGQLAWHREFDQFDSELGLASSPIIHQDRVLLVCDHDGNRFTSFDSFLIALDLTTGQTIWKTDRPKLLRSWSTPIVVETKANRAELIVNAQDELRAYDPQSGTQLWHVRGMTGWVTPSPVFGQDLIFATSGRDGPTMAVRPGGRGDVTDQRIEWQKRRGAPYVCSPLLYDGLLYVHNEQGVLSCFDAATGKTHYQERIGGKFFASGVAGDGKIYLTDEQGTTHVIQAGPVFRSLAQNQLDEECLASPAIAQQMLLLRTRFDLYCIQAE